MKFIATVLLSAMIASVAVVLYPGLVSDNQAGVGIDVPTRYPNGHLDTGAGYYVDGSVVVNEYGTLTPSGEVLQVSTTDTTATATVAQLSQYNVFELTAVAAAGQSAVTFKPPASTTFTTLIPNAGDSLTYWVFDSHTGAATTTTIGTNTGLDLEVSTTTDGASGNTGTTKVLKNGWSAQVTLVRQATGGDIKQLVNVFGDI